MDAVNIVQVRENITSSAQPSEADFSSIAAQGYGVVINLALSSSDNAIPGEGDIVSSLGMSYVHIPIPWVAPRREHFELFAAVMQQVDDGKVWVHCALNMRVSVFLYLYSILFLNISEKDALDRLHRVWKPNKLWSQFIADVIAFYGK